MLPVADVLHVHPVFFGRNSQYEQGAVPNMPVQLDNVAYLGSGCDRAINEVSDVYYGQVIAMGTVTSSVDGACQDHDFLFIRNYTCPLALSELRLQATTGGPRTAVPQLDDRGFPLTMRPLVWEPAEPSTSRGRSVGFAPGKYSVISPDMLLQQVCIVKDYKRGEGNFLVNDLVHWPSKDLLTYTAADAVVSTPLPFFEDGERHFESTYTSVTDMARSAGVLDDLCQACENVAKI
jgi:hypothetical protein